jgi:TldD protein
MLLRYESMSAKNGDVEDLVQRESVGVGVRALVGSSWGFVAVPDPTDAEARRAGGEATAVARASGLVAGPELAPVPVEARQDSWASTCEEDPLGVPLGEKGDLVAGVTATMRAAGIPVAEASYQAWDTAKWLVSSEGHRIEQRIRECGAAMSATAIGAGETQRRSYPGIRGQYGTRGWELVRELDLPAHAGRIAQEAQALLTAPPCPAGTTDLILGSEQMALQIHESVGHAVELDRILGWEAAFAGTSWLDLGRLGSLRFGSPLMTITADATLPGALGSFGYDDEGTPAAPVDIVRDGTWVGVLSGRDSAAAAGLSSRLPPGAQAPRGGMVRADGWARLPMVRMTNVGLLPGDSSLEEMIAATDDGVLMDTNRSWSIDDRRLNFQFGCEIGWEVKRGRRGRMLRNPTYTGISPRFWGSMDLLGGPDEWRFWGTPNCGKGQPSQVGHTGHPAVPARFRAVRVGVSG